MRVFHSGLIVLFLGIAAAVVPVYGWIAYCILAVVAFVLGIIALVRKEVSGGIWVLGLTLISPFVAFIVGTIGVVVIVSLTGRPTSH